LRFDEELLRQAFYQCLHPPYLTNTGGSMRADAMHLIRAAAVLHPFAITVPLNEKGRPSFKLDRLAPANGFDHAKAHDAMADVEALIFLCRIVRDLCPDLWARFLRFGHKAAVDQFIRSETAFVVLEYFPAQTGCYVTSGIGQSRQPNVEYTYDLSVDPEPMLAMNDDELAKRLSQRPRPLRKIRKNAAPSLCPLEDAPDSMFVEATRAEYRRRAEIVRTNRVFNSRLIAISDSLDAPRETSPHVEQQIYDGFWSRADDQQLAAFHAGTWEDRVKIADRLEDQRLRWLARRLVFVERPDLLSPDARTSMSRDIAMRHLCEVEESAGWTPLRRSINETEALRQDSDQPIGGAWSRLDDYLTGKVNEAQAALQNREFGCP
jgi:exodeoxyribonuclease-1